MKNKDLPLYFIENKTLIKCNDFKSLKTCLPKIDEVLISLEVNRSKPIDDWDLIVLTLKSEDWLRFVKELKLKNSKIRSKSEYIGFYLLKNKQFPIFKVTEFNTLSIE